MSPQSRIALLQERFWSGDASARAALEHLLKEYLALVFRRLARRSASDSPISLGIQRWTQGQNDRTAHPADLPNADEVCRRVCDELLESPTFANRQDIFDTIPFFTQTEKC